MLLRYVGWQMEKKIGNPKNFYIHAHQFFSSLAHAEICILCTSVQLPESKTVTYVPCFNHDVVAHVVR